MTIDKLFKRFMKEEAVFGSDESKSSLMFMIDYSEALHPFNSFRWDTSKQGQYYWLEKSIKWVMYLLQNYDNIDETEMAKYTELKKTDLYEALKNLFVHYTPDGAQSLKNFDFYDSAMAIMAENNISID